MTIRKVALLVIASMLGSSCALIDVKTACNGTQIIAQFEQVGDLVRNANVQSSDVEIGTVKDIELDGWEARVTMCLQADEKIPQDSLAVIRKTSLLGEKFIDLRPQSFSPPYLEDGAILGSDQTSKATELEDVFARLASVLGTGNLEQINRFTSAQAKILRGNASKLRRVLRDLREFTGLLANRKSQIAEAVDGLDTVAKTLVDQAPVLERFLESFADSSEVLADQKNGLRSLLFSLDRFTKISVQLLEQTEDGLNEQFQKLRPVLATIVANSTNLRRTLQTLATFSQWFPETMPGEYLQLDVCQAGEEDFDQGTNCPQSDQNQRSAAATEPTNSTELILTRPLRGQAR